MGNNTDSAMSSIEDIEYDILIIGPVSLDCNVDYLGNERRELGGAIVQSGYAAVNSGNKVAIYTKFNQSEVDKNNLFKDAKDIRLIIGDSKHTCSIKNIYNTPDCEERRCISTGVCDRFYFDEIQDIKTDIYYFAGLIEGDFDEEIIKEASRYGKTALDTQSVLRYVKDNGEMDFRDWLNKKEYMPYIDYLKADAKEAKILTGCDDRYEAARELKKLGAKEIMISHNTEMLIYDGEEFYTCPVVSDNLSGRTGRGDTVFAAYVTERRTKSIEESLQYATALVSLKMETPGPYKGTRENVYEYIKSRYIKDII